jgi:hypothetical protein
MTDVVELCGKDLACSMTAMEVDAEGVLGYTYGIKVSRGGEPYYENPDVATDKAFVGYMIGMLEKHQVSGLHIQDVIEDMLAQSLPEAFAALEPDIDEGYVNEMSLLPSLRQQGD